MNPAEARAKLAELEDRPPDGVSPEWWGIYMRRAQAEVCAVHGCEPAGLFGGRCRWCDEVPG